MDVVVYGADWCEDTQRSRHFLDARRVPYRYVDVDADREAEAYAKSLNRGERRTPTIVIDQGRRVLIEPSDAELADTLGSA